MSSRRAKKTNIGRTGIDPADNEAEPLLPHVADEAKAIVALAYRNGPIEEIHAGKACPTCDDDPRYSHISDAEMKQIMKFAVNQVYMLLRLKMLDPSRYAQTLQLGSLYTTAWDDPESGLVKPKKQSSKK